MSATLQQWVADAPDAEVQRALSRLVETPDVQHVAVMPDVHLAHGVCIGTVTATGGRIFPEAVGGDIGCGMAAIRFDLPPAALTSDKHAAAVLGGLYRAVPFIKHARADAPELPRDLPERPLSSAALERLKRREGSSQLGTLGRGNHFLELQRDQDQQLWLMVHSGSRAIGPAIRDQHLALAAGGGGLRWLDAGDSSGEAYLADAAWARAYARANRRLMVERVCELMHELFGAKADAGSLIDCDHNHVQRESHAGRELWVHRKGALDARDGEPGVIPGSMGSPSFHVVGRGCAAALCSSSHGAGRVLSRGEARRRIGRQRLFDETVGVWFDQRLAERLREESPAAYKDIGRVMRAQRELTRIVRKLQPVLVYKGG